MNGTDDSLLAEANSAIANYSAQAGAVGAKPLWWSVENAMTISSAVLIFGAVVIGIAAFTTPKDAPLDSKLRLFGTIMVLTLVAFVVVAGYDKDQIAAPLGLLGTIAGYLLGRSDQRSAPAPAPPA